MKSTVVNSVIKLRAVTAPFFQTGPVLFFTIAGSQIIDNINTSTFLTAVEDIQERFDANYALASWAMSAYAVTYAGFLVCFGRVSDIVGHHIVLTAGMFILGVFSVISAVVPNIYVFIVFRALQGVCAAATVPASWAIVAHSFEGRALNLALAVLSVSLTIAMGGGFIIGGAFSLTSIGYKSICWFTAGTSFLSSTMCLLSLKPVNSYQKGALRRLDFFGIFLLVAGGILMVTGFTEAGNSWKRPVAYVPIVLGIILILAFGLFETLFFRDGRGASIEMIIPKVLWSVKNFKIFPFVIFFAYSGFMAIFAISLQYSMYVYEDSPLIAGVRLVPFLAAQAVTILGFSAIPYGKYSPKWLCGGGLFFVFISTIVFNRVKLVSNGYWRYFLPGYIVFGIANALFFLHYFNMIILATPLRVQGLVSAVCMTLGQYGVAMGLSVVTSIIGNSNTGITDKAELSEVYVNAFYLPLALYAVSAALVIFLIRDLKPGDMKQAGNEPESPESDQEIKPDLSQDATNPGENSPGSQPVTSRESSKATANIA